MSGNMMPTPMGPPASPFEGPTATKMKDNLGQRNDAGRILVRGLQGATDNIRRRLSPPPQMAPGSFVPPPDDPRIAALNAEMARLKALAAQLEFARAKAAGEMPGMNALPPAPFDPSFGLINWLQRKNPMNYIPLLNGTFSATNPYEAGGFNPNDYPHQVR